MLKIYTVHRIDLLPQEGANDEPFASIHLTAQATAGLLLVIEGVLDIGYLNPRRVITKTELETIGLPMICLDIYDFTLTPNKLQCALLIWQVKRLPTSEDTAVDELGSLCAYQKPKICTKERKD
jgi:hypothetical protein